MSNWFRLTPDSSLDREYLRICAVYRCASRYGVSKQWAIEKLTERGATNPKRLVELWTQRDSNRKIYQGEASQ